MTRVGRIIRPAIVPILAVLSAFLVGSVFMFITDIENLKNLPTDPAGTIIAGVANVGNAYYAMVIGAFGDPSKIVLAIGSSDPKVIASAIRPLTETLVAATPLIFCGLGIAIAFRSGGHDHGPQDWTTLLDFCDSVFHGRPRAEVLQDDPFPGLPAPASWYKP